MHIAGRSIPEGNTTHSVQNSCPHVPQECSASAIGCFTQGATTFSARSVRSVRSGVVIGLRRSDLERRRSPGGRVSVSRATAGSLRDSRPGWARMAR